MKIKLKKGKPVSDESILALQAALGCQVSGSFKDFVLGNDGAEPETNIFKITAKNESGVNRFIPVGEILKEREHVGNIPTKAYPVAWAEGGMIEILCRQNDVVGKKLIAFLQIDREWMPPNQAQGVINVKDMVEVVGEEGVSRLLAVIPSNARIMAGD